MNIFLIDRKREYESMNIGVHMPQLVYGGQRTTWESELSPFTMCALGIDIRLQMSLLNYLASLFVHVFV